MDCRHYATDRIGKYIVKRAASYELPYRIQILFSSSFAFDRIPRMLISFGRQSVHVFNFSK